MLSVMSTHLLLLSGQSRHGAGQYLFQQWGSLHFSQPPDRGVVFHFQVIQAKVIQGSYSQEEISPEQIGLAHSVLCGLTVR